LIKKFTWKYSTFRNQIEVGKTELGENATSHLKKMKKANALKVMEHMKDFF